MSRRRVGLFRCRLAVLGSPGNSGRNDMPAGLTVKENTRRARRDKNRNEYAYSARTVPQRNRHT